jgi:hypothetical protein
MQRVEFVDSPALTGEKIKTQKPPLTRKEKS